MPARPRHHNGRLARIAAAPALALLAMALATGPAVAQTARTEALEAVERALEEDRGAAESLGREAEKLKLEIRALRADSIAAARQAQEHEARLSDIETRLGELEREEAVKLADLQERRMQLTGTLAALQRIALLPAYALIVALHRLERFCPRRLRHSRPSGERHGEQRQGRRRGDPGEAPVMVARPCRHG